MFHSPKVIYDLGAHVGANIPYYLLRAERVVAVEANPVLCTGMRARFARECEDGRLVIENQVLLASDGPSVVDFWIHKKAHFLSQFPRPQEEALADFDCVQLHSGSVVAMFERHGPPFYVKCDLERYDAVILRAMLRCGIIPPYVSAECHDPQVLAVLIEMGYGAFKLVDGASVHQRYRDRMFRDGVSGLRARYRFPPHSAGPFGDDVDGPWLSTQTMCARLGIEGFGWKDIHASLVPVPDSTTGAHLATCLSSVAATAKGWLSLPLRRGTDRVLRLRRALLNRGR